MGQVRADPLGQGLITDSWGQARGEPQGQVRADPQDKYAQTPKNKYGAQTLGGKYTSQTLSGKCLIHALVDKYIFWALLGICTYSKGLMDKYAILNLTGNYVDSYFLFATRFLHSCS